MKNYFSNKYALKPTNIQFSKEKVRTYEATDLKTGKDVYLKVVQRNDVCLAHFNNFIQSWKQKQNIDKMRACQYFPSIYEVCSLEKVAWTSIERGSTNLQKFFNQKNGFTFNQIFSNLLEITSAACYLKSIGVVHCNLKHSLVQFRAPNHILMINGLEYCVQLENLEEDPSLKQKFNLENDLRFLAPQLLDKDSCITQKCTVWNIGVILYWMLFQKWPYPTEQFKEQVQKPLKIPVVAKNYNSILNNTLKGCLNINKEQRYSLTQVLENVLKLANINQKCHNIIKQKQKDIILAIDKLPCYPTIFKRIGQEKIVDDNINYIYLLDKFSCLLDKSQIQIKQVPMRGLTKYIIKCRIEHLKRHLYWNSTNSLNYDSLNQQFQQLNQKHFNNTYQQFTNYLSNQRYFNFQNTFYGHREIVYLHYQVFLRDFIVRITRKLFRKMQSQPEFCDLQYAVHILNDALFIFHINGNLIESVQNCKWEFVAAGELEQALNFGISDDPYNLFKDSAKKVLSLDILEDEALQKEIKERYAFE